MSLHEIGDEIELDAEITPTRSGVHGRYLLIYSVLMVALASGIAAVAALATQIP